VAGGGEGEELLFERDFLEKKTVVRTLNMRTTLLNF